MVEKTTIKCEAIFSDDARHRYVLRKEWDKSKPKACVITIAPSADFNVTSDLTTQLIQNNLTMLDFGGFELVNLYSKVTTSKDEYTSKGMYNRDTDKYIKESCEASETIVMAWGKAHLKSKELSARVEAVNKLLEKHISKLYFIADENGRSELHPLTPSVRKKWNLVKAVATNTAPTGNWDGEITIE